MTEWGILFINFKLIAFGVSLIGIGWSMLANPTFLDAIKLSKLEEHENLYIVSASVGPLACFAGLVGFFAVIKKSKRALLKQIYLLGMLCLCEFGLGIGSSFFQSWVVSSVNTNMDVHGKLLDFVTDDLYVKVQQELKCCGATKGCSDWNPKTSASYGCECDPKIDLTPNCSPPNSSYCISHMKYIFQQPCSVPIIKILYNNLQIISSVDWCMAATEVLGVLYILIWKWRRTAWDD